MRHPMNRMPQPNVFKKVFQRMMRDVKSLFGVESYLQTEDRRVLEEIIFPYLVHEERFKDIVFVGCHWYTSGYSQRFQEKKNYWTIDVKASRRKYGAKQHIVDGMQNLDRAFPPGALDVVICNGVFGWGLDARTDVEQAFAASHTCLRTGGVLIVGWDDIEERRPFPLGTCQSLRQFHPFVLPPLGTAHYVTDTPYHHTFNFYIKP